MIGLLAALAIAATPPEPDAAAFEARMKASAAAAQALQGDLDGTWTLRDGHGRPLYVFQITDPAGGAGPLEAAWRSAGTASGMGLIDDIDRRGGRLVLRFTPDAGPSPTAVRLTRRGAMSWTGWVEHGGQTRRVILARRR